MKIVFLLALFIGCSVATLIVPVPTRGLGFSTSLGLGGGVNIIQIECKRIL